MISKLRNKAVFEMVDHWFLQVGYLPKGAIEDSVVKIKSFILTETVCNYKIYGDKIDK